MTRSLLLAACGLVATFSLTWGATQAEARHNSRNNCCQQTTICGAQGSRHNSRRHRYCGHQQSGCCGATVAYAMPTGCDTQTSTACCAPQSTCCSGPSAAVTMSPSTQAVAPAPPVEAKLAPAPGL